MKSLNPGRTALLALALLLGTAGAASAQQPAVRLTHAKLQTVCGNVFCSRLVGAVEVLNLAYEKQVALAYTTGDGQWAELSASYVAPVDGAYESWAFSQDVPAGAQVRFAVRYTVAGQTYWDNNSGNDYRVGGDSAPAFILGSAGVKLDTASYQSSRGGYFVTGFVVLKNLAYAKDVTAVYTTDDWLTVQERAGTHFEEQARSGGSLERWVFSIPVNAATVALPTVRFAIRYTVEGVTYWDNNSGRNYSLSYPNSIQ